MLRILRKKTSTTNTESETERRNAEDEKRKRERKRLIILKGTREPMGRKHTKGRFLAQGNGNGTPTTISGMSYTCSVVQGRMHE